MAKIEFHPGELLPTTGFLVTNRSLPNERVFAFYNQRGTAEQHIKEGKYALKWTRLSCMRFAANAVAAASCSRLQSGQLSADHRDARGNSVMVTDLAAGAPDQDRHKAGQARVPSSRWRRPVCPGLCSTTFWL